MYLRVPDAAGFVFPQAFQSVGLGLGNAIGAAIARPDRLTVAALGDGGALMALPELETLGRLGLPLLVVIYDDAAYGAEVHHFRPLGQLVDLAQFPDTLTDGAVRVVDLTQPLSERTPVLQLPEPLVNTPGLSRRELSHYDERGPAWAWSVLEVGEHVGTHFDAPIHWITGRDGEDVASVPAARLVGPAAVIDKSLEAAADPDYLLTVDDVQAFESDHGPLSTPAGCCCAPVGMHAHTTRTRCVLAFVPG